MAGIRVTAWDDWSFVTLVDGVQSAAGSIDSGNLSDQIDGPVNHLCETDGYVLTVAGYPYNDTAAGTNQPFLSSAYASVRRPFEASSGCKAFVYSNGFTPDPVANYAGTPPGRITGYFGCCASLPNNKIALTSGQDIYIGGAGQPTSKGTLTASGYTVRKARAIGRLWNGKVVIAYQVIRSGDSQPCILLTGQIDTAAIPATIAVETALTYNGVNPWKAAMAALCAIHGANLQKVQSQKYVIPSGVDAWAGTLVYQVGDNSASLLSLSDEMYNEGYGDASPSRIIKQGVLSFGVVGDALTYSGSATSDLVNGDYYISTFTGESVQSPSNLYADYHDWTPPAVPRFWTNLIKTQERP